MQYLFENKCPGCDALRKWQRCPGKSAYLCVMEKRGEIILYQPDSEVRLEDETVWLTQAQIVELFQSSKANISEHIKNIYEQGELDESSTVRSR